MGLSSLPTLDLVRTWNRQGQVRIHQGEGKTWLSGSIRDCISPLHYGVPQGAKTPLISFTKKLSIYEPETASQITKERITQGT